jgi:hypothetical protein
VLHSQQNTIKAYSHNWAIFSDSCSSAGRVPLPAEAETARLFVTWAVSVRRRCYRLNSVRLFLCSGARIVKRLLLRSGTEPAQYGGHSLRAGKVTAAAERGATETSMMQRTGHKSFATLRRSFRPREAFACDPLAGVL